MLDLSTHIENAFQEADRYQIRLIKDSIELLRIPPHEADNIDDCLPPAQFLIIAKPTQRVISSFVIFCPNMSDEEWEETTGDPHKRVYGIVYSVKPDQYVQAILEGVLQEKLGYDLGMDQERIQASKDWLEAARQQHEAGMKL